MENSKQLADRFREVILKGKWIANTNFKDQVTDLSWELATKKVGSLNSIAALIFHVDYYIGGTLNVFKGGDLEIRDKYSFDMPPIKSPEDWEKLKATMWSNAEEFANYLERLPDSKLDSVFVDEKYGNYRRNMEGMIEHSYYHLGQISLIKKMLTAS